MPGPNQNSIIPTALNKHTADTLVSLTFGTLSLTTAEVLDTEEIQGELDEAGNALTQLAEDASNRDYQQAQQRYALAKAVMQALQTVVDEPTDLEDLTTRETATINQLNVIGTQALSPAALSFADPAGLAAIAARNAQ